MSHRNLFRKAISVLLALVPVLSPAPVRAMAAGQDVPVCGCESDDPSWHAPFCEAYVAPEDPQCLCVEKCAEGAANEWCEVCYFVPAACAASGEEEAAVYATAPNYIASIGIAQDGSSGNTGINDCKNELSGHTIIDRDLNDGAGGDYVYMGYKTTTDPAKAITGIVFRVGGSPPNSITYNGYTFYLVGGSTEANTASLGGYIDLNAAAGGDYIYMYVTRDPSYGAPLIDMTVDESSSKSGYSTGTNTSGGVIDLNQDARGKYLYLHYKQFSATVKATYHYLNASGSRTSSTQSGTVKTHLEQMTKVPSYANSVTYDGRTFKFLGWRDDNTAGAAEETSPFATYMTGTKTYLAVYQGNVTVSFDANGGNGAPSAVTGTQYINAGTSSVSKGNVSVTIPSGSCTHPTKCNLLGWSTETTATSATYQPGGSITVSSNTTLYAVYGNHSYNDKGICTACSGLDHTCQYSANGFCTRCDGYQPAVLKDGYYQITNGGNLFWFAKHINTVDRTANAKLTADINLENKVWTPIGFTGEVNNNFRGKFDGQGHTITGLNVNANRAGSGFFGEVRLGTVKNFTIEGNVTVTANNITYVGGVIGSAPGANSNQPDHNGATISNITSYVNVTVEDGKTGVGRIGGFIGYANHETIIENCAWYGTVDLGNQTMDVGAGGFIGRVNDNSNVTIRNCGAYGSIINDGVTANVGAFMGITASGSNTVIENCLFAGSVSGAKASSVTPFGTWSGASKTLTNSYYINTLQKTDADATAVTAAQLSSGEVAYKLGAAWGQTIGTEAFPVLSGKKVYTVTDCKDVIVRYSNAVEPTVHYWSDNGFCTKCDAYEPAPLVGGTYEISNAGQLYWFAKQVNSGSKFINGKLTADITVNANVLKEDGTLNGDGSTFRVWTPIGYHYNRTYSGSFDGANHTVSGLYANNNTSSVGLCGNLEKGTVKNVGIVDSYFRGTSYVGGVVGCNEGTVTGCHNTGTVTGNKSVGGVVGYGSEGRTLNCYNSGSVTGNEFVGGVAGCGFHNTVSNCYNAGAVSGVTEVGGLVGKNSTSSTVSNCHNTGTVTGDSNVGGVVGKNYTSGTVTNCYYDSAVYSGDAIGTNEETAAEVLGKTTQQFASGEVAYLLSLGCTVGEGESAVTYPGDVWGQNIDGEGEKDAYPVFSNSRVYEVLKCDGTLDSYSNTANKQADHIYDNGFCTLCEGFQPAQLVGDTYEISNAGQLYWFAAKVNSGSNSINGKLIADIVVNEDVLKDDGTLKVDGSTFRAWTPIGTYSVNYTGTFDGNSKTVSGLYFNDSSTDYVGLFGYVQSGTVQNVGVVDSYLSGSYYVGGVVGYNNGTMTECYNTGTVSGDNIVGGVVGENNDSVSDCYNTGTVSGRYYAGGVVGENYATVTGCYNTGAVSGEEYVGGVVGLNYSPVTECYNTGTVSGGNYVGGVVGSNNGPVTECYNTGTVSGRYCVGGMVGSNSGPVTECYNTGTVSGNYNVGGVVGFNHGGTVANCYSIGTVSGRYSAGGVVCYNDEGNVANCYFDSTIYIGDAINDNDGTAINVEGKTTAQFASGEVAYLLSLGCTVGEGEAAVTYPGDVWGQNIDGDGERDAYPVFSDAKVYRGKACNGEVYGYSNTEGKQLDHTYENGFCTVCGGFQSATGNGTESDPYKIGNAGQLYWFAAVVNDGYGGVEQNLAACAELTADITVNENVLAEDGSLNEGTFRPWTPVGNIGYRYTGTFDGKEFTVSGLCLNSNDASYVGLFGYISGGTVQNVGVVDSYLSGSNIVGGLVGYNDGSVTNCYSIGTIVCRIYAAGGLVGYNNGTVENCYSNGSVSGSISGTSHTGGLAGDNYGTMAGCYHTGSVSGTILVGGLAGDNHGTLVGCYHTGSISGEYRVGGVVYDNKGTVVNCYFDSTAYSGNAIVFDNGTATDVLGKTTEQFASGEVAYLLSRDCTLGEGETAVTYPGDVWGQNIDGAGDKDTYPVFSDAKVYFGYYDCLGSYTNNSSVSQVKPEHSGQLTYADNGDDATHTVTCDTCGDVVDASQIHIYGEDHKCLCGAVEEVLSVNISWGSMVFVYTEEAGWNNPDSAWVKTENTGNLQISVTYTYETDRTDIAGIFSNGTNSAAGTAVILPEQTYQVWLRLEGEPVEVLDNAVIGTVKVTVGYPTCFP